MSPYWDETAPRTSVQLYQTETKQNMEEIASTEERCYNKKIQQVSRFFNRKGNARRFLILCLISTSYLVEFCEDFLQFGRNRISHLHRTRCATNILCSNSALNSSSYSFFDGFRLGGQAKRILEHHGNGKDGSNRVDDSFARNVWCGP